MLSRDLRGACSPNLSHPGAHSTKNPVQQGFRRAVGMYSHSTLHQTWQMQNHSNLHPAFWAAQEQQQQH